LIDLSVRPGLSLLRRPYRRPEIADSSVAHSIESTTALNQAAEDYYKNFPAPDFILGKPFSEPASLSRRLIDLGVLIDGLRVVPGDTVLELGAGSCWVSHALNKIGCRTIAVDVSPTALQLGQQLFASDTRTNWTLRPEFLPYDGLTLPVADASVDGIVVYDAFHHLPNPERLLREMRRALQPSGVVAMSEPGRGHAGSMSSRAESDDTGVLERELVIEEIGSMAVAAGFHSARCVVASNHPLLEVETSALWSFMGGRDFSRYWSRLCAALDSHYYVLLFAGDPVPTTARPKHLKAIITEAGGATQLRGQIASPAIVDLTVRNVGDTRWLSDADRAGWTRLGAHLYADGTPPRLLDFDWHRAALPHNVDPDRSVKTIVTLPPLQAGTYQVVIDLVVEGIAWFGDRESAPLFLRLDVR
jgi:SAM-dependent methyltransferase